MQSYCYTGCYGCLRAGSYVAIQAPQLKLRGIGGVGYKILALLRTALEASGQTDNCLWCVLSVCLNPKLLFVVAGN
jgi:hypothetical protein